MTTTFEKGTYELALANGSKRTVAGYTFNHEGIKLGVEKTDTGWLVTDIQTGLSIGNFKQPTRKAAVEGAIREITRITPEIYKAKVEEFLNPKEEKEEPKQEESETKKADDKAKQEEVRKAKADKEKAERETQARKQHLKQAKNNAQAFVNNKKHIMSPMKLIKQVQDAIAQAVTIDDEEYRLIYINTLCEELAKLNLSTDEPKAEDPKVEEEPKKKWNIGVFFKGIADMDALKKAYKKFTKWLHPDVSDYANAEEAFLALQAQYEKAEKLIRQGKTVEAEPTKADTQDVPLSDFLKNAINKINHLEDIEISVRGTWVWVSGVERTAYDVHKVLKENGFRFGAKTLEWYLADETAGTKKRRGKGYSADQLKDKWGEINLKSKGQVNQKSKLKGPTPTV